MERKTIMGVAAVAGIGTCIAAPVAAWVCTIRKRGVAISPVGGGTASTSAAIRGRSTADY